MADPLALFRRYILPGDLVFNIGANLGKHTAWMLALEARVIAVEPQHNMAEQIPRHKRLTVIEAAVSDHAGTAEMYVSPGHEYVTTITASFREKAQTHATYAYLDPVLVRTITLDSLIADYGIPAFCKIDVEGHEREVLAGLSTALPALSFEVHDFEPEKAGDCLARLAELGDYDLFFCSRESFEPQPWPAEVDIFGDIWAVLQH